MKKRIFSILLCLAMVLTLLPTAALAEYTVTDGSATVSSLTDLQSALEDNSVAEIIVSQTIPLPAGTALAGNKKGVRAPVTGVNESGIVQTGSDYMLFTIAHGAAVSISNLKIMGGSRYAIYNSGTLTMNNVIVTRSGSAASDSTGNCSGGGIYNGGSGKLILTGCSIVRNAAAFGGGMLNDGGTVVMDGCSLSENRSLNSNGGGGAAENRNGAKMYINNTSSEIGGGINNYKGILYLMNTTVTGNATTATLNYGGGIGNNGGTLYAVNSIITDPTLSL